MIVEGDAAGLSDAGMVLSEMPVTVDRTLSAPVPLLVRSVVATTKLDCASSEPFAVGKGYTILLIVIGVFILGEDLQDVQSVVDLNDL